MTDYEIVELEQGSIEWHAWRAKGIGASDAPTIMGENPWKSDSKLFYEKLEQRLGNGSGQRSMNAAMARGSALEPAARAAYQRQTGHHVQPACIQSKRYPWMLASLDGFSLETNTAVEIKCGESVYRRSYQSGRVPDYYYGQLQHILAICQLGSVDFWCFLPNRSPVLLNVPRNDSYIDNLIDREAVFWGQLTGDRPRTF